MQLTTKKTTEININYIQLLRVIINNYLLIITKI